MSVEKKDYQITKTKTLIDINKHLTNFRAKVDVNSNDMEYELAILTQDELDGNVNVEIPYQKVKGSFQDMIQVTDNQYQNFYLILKSTLPITVNVTITLQELPPSQPEPQQQLENQQPIANYPSVYPEGTERTQGIYPSDEYIPSQEEVSIKPKNNIWKYIFYGCLILIAIFVVYKFVLKGTFDFSKLFKSKKISPSPIPLPSPVIEELNLEPVKDLIKETLKESANETKELIKDIKETIIESTSSLPENITETVKESLKDVQVSSQSPSLDLKTKNSLKSKYKFLF